MRTQNDSANITDSLHICISGIFHLFCFIVTSSSFPKLEHVLCCCQEFASLFSYNICDILQSQEPNKQQCRVYVYWSVEFMIFSSKIVPNNKSIVMQDGQIYISMCYSFNMNSHSEEDERLCSHMSIDVWMLWKL